MQDNATVTKGYYSFNGHGDIIDVRDISGAHFVIPVCIGAKEALELYLEDMKKKTFLNRLF